MYLAMARVAYREGYPEVGLYFEKAAFEEAEHAAKFAELLGEVVTPSTKKNLELRYMAENGACEGKMKIAKIKVDSLIEKCKNDGVNIDKVCEFCKVKKPEELTEALYSNIINHWNDVKAKCV